MTLTFTQTKPDKVMPPESLRFSNLNCKFDSSLVTILTRNKGVFLKKFIISLLVLVTTPIYAHRPLFLASCYYGETNRSERLPLTQNDVMHSPYGMQTEELRRIERSEKAKGHCYKQLIQIGTLGLTLSGAGQLVSDDSELSPYLVTGMTVSAAVTVLGVILQCKHRK